MTAYVGIDPGLDGGVAILRPDGARPWTFVIPTIGVGAAKRVLDLPGLLDVLCHASAPLVFVERQQALPAQGASSGFKTGQNYGAILGLLAGLRLPHETVSAATWKRGMGLPASVPGASKATATQQRKAAAIELAVRLFPTASLRATERSRKLHDGMAEALLLAEWGRRRAGGGA